MRDDPRTRRRLAAGEEAKALPEPTTATEIRKQLDVLYDGMVALQSLDDLGSEEANQKAWDDMLALQKRYDALRARLTKMEGK